MSHESRDNEELQSVWPINSTCRLVLKTADKTSYEIVYPRRFSAYERPWDVVESAARGDASVPGLGLVYLQGLMLGILFFWIPGLCDSTNLKKLYRERNSRRDASADICNVTIRCVQFQKNV